MMDLISSLDQKMNSIYIITLCSSDEEQTENHSSLIPLFSPLRYFRLEVNFFLFILSFNFPLLFIYKILMIIIIFKYKEKNKTNCICEIKGVIILYNNSGEGAHCEALGGRRSFRWSFFISNLLSIN